MQPTGYQPPVFPQPTPQSDPYAFLNQVPNKPRLRLSGSFGGGSRAKRLIVAIGGLLVLVVLLAIFKSALSSGNGVDLSSLYYVIGEQQELIGLTTTGSQSTQNQGYLNLSYTIMASATTDKDKLVSLLEHNGMSLSSKKLVLQPSADQTLAQSLQNSTFDSVYPTVLRQQLNLYLQELSDAYAKNKSSVIQAYLKTDYDNAKLLINMFNNPTG